MSVPSWGRSAEPDPPGVTVAAWQVSAAKFASWVAMLTLVYFLWLYTLDIARDRAGALHMTHAGVWTGDVQFWFPYIVGFALVAFGIPYVAKISLPTFMALTWRDAPWAKGWSLFLVVAVSTVIIAGTFTVQGNTLMERERDSAVAVEGVQQEAAVLALRIADKKDELDDMVNNASVYVRTAASMSPAAYDVFVEERRGDWQYDRLRSYRATSVDAQRLRDEITALRDQQARQTAVASVQREVVTERTGWVASLLGWLEGARAILLSLVMDFVALLMPWIARKLELVRNMQLALATGVAGSGWADESHRIPDLRAMDAVEPQPMKPAREAVYDAETGEELVPVKATWRRKPKRKGVKEQVEIAPEVPPDERGVAVDGGGRAGAIGQGQEALSDEAPNEPTNDRAQQHVDHEQDEHQVLEPAGQTEPPEIDEAEAAELLAVLDGDADQQDEPSDNLNPDKENGDDDHPVRENHLSLPDGEGVMVEDDPNKVAAE